MVIAIRGKRAWSHGFMSYALSMAMALATLAAARHRHPAQTPLFIAALLFSACVLFANTTSSLNLTW
jgi:hypothetical protein